METTNVMKKQKRTYLKPTLKVAEWDFNEAVCQSQVSQCSLKDVCITIREADSHDVVGTRQDAGEWHRMGSR